MKDVKGRLNSKWRGLYSGGKVYMSRCAFKIGQLSKQRPIASARASIIAWGQVFSNSLVLSTRMDIHVRENL